MTHQTTPDQNPTKTRAKVLDLSLTQLLGGSAAAATAAALGSRLGVVGTIAGAAVLSLISAVAASLYTASMTRARDAVVLVRSRRGDLEEVPLYAVEPPEIDTDVAVGPAADPHPPRSPAWWRRVDRASTRRVLVTTGALFAIAAAFLTGLQLATGAQVTGTSIGGRVSAASGADTSTDRSGGAVTSPTNGATGTPTVPGAGATGGASASAGAAQTGQATDGSATTGATSGASPTTAPATTQTAPASSGSPAGGIPTGGATPSATATSP
ncbi:hypothetical protein FHX52_0534 [Humibacillus xanthopallidus]|uniref:Uncharacterized protein n=1 Tax=Humibacillus xanthopallidus TaxID=412689 RepID=A0A543PTN2_9MICO|nr:hypothetical protein [Humibacillus xanthopallidus]TQN47434.1 hypothetical protein FHX52_0534 [Humibacillus xanthopallidus]